MSDNKSNMPFEFEDKTKEELNLTMVKMLFKILYKTNKISKKEFESLMKNANRTSKLENI
ncbi:MAG: hypothetical protein SPF04_05505 [Bacilli bacterium]|nr:hypothetical protein [Bacilli bacterium]